MSQSPWVWRLGFAAGAVGLLMTVVYLISLANGDTSPLVVTGLIMWPLFSIVGSLVGFRALTLARRGR